MNPTEQSTGERFLVVMNDEEQYSIWLADKPVPNGWKTIGEKRKKPECLKHIGEVWTDMRPKSLRESMEKDRSS